MSSHFVLSTNSRVRLFVNNKMLQHLACYGTILTPQAVGLPVKMNEEEQGQFVVQRT